MGIGVLWLLRCAHSIVPRGCYIDGDAVALNMEDAAMFPNKYIRMFLEQRSESTIAQDKDNKKVAYIDNGLGDIKNSML